jgi:transcriptional regulator with XRE-family HTH domain
MSVSGTTVVRRQLGRRLERLREAAGVTAVDVEKAHIASRTKVWRIESGLVPVKVPDVQALCRLYGASAEETEALTRMAVGTGERGWWQEYADVAPEWFRLYVDLESQADRIQTWEDSVVPGELQTAEYARAVFQAAHSNGGTAAIERQVELRLKRQERLFTREPAPGLVIVLGEGVLARPVGGAAVLTAQIEHLRELGQRDGIDIRVLPFTTGAHAAMTGAFRILDFEDPADPDVVYVEAQVGGMYLEKPSELDEYRTIFEMIYKQAVPIGEHK